MQGVRASVPPAMPTPASLKLLGYLVGGLGAIRCCAKLVTSSTGMASTFAVLVVAGYVAFKWQQYRSMLEKEELMMQNRSFLAEVNYNYERSHPEEVHRRKLRKQKAAVPQKKKGEKVPSQRNSIKLIKQFSDFYTMGSKVMPSTHRGQEVLFAKRRLDGMAVVVKTTEKACSFSSKHEEEHYRRSTEMQMNMPASENIMRTHEVLEDAFMYYVVMEKVEGMDLCEVLRNKGGLPIDEAKAILRQLLQAVQDLHSMGCIHKDLKPENVMVDSPKSASGPTVVKLIDLDTVEEFSPKTTAKTILGTDQYIPQEAYGGHYSPASDIFSVGVIAYRLFSGKLPFKSTMFDDKPGGNYVGSPKMKIIQDRLNHFHINFDAVETEARDLTRWMLQNDEKDRPTAAQALQHAFFETTGKTPALPKNKVAPVVENAKRKKGTRKTTDSLFLLVKPLLLPSLF